ncbi:Gfo/Idh/MocA family protein [Fimbriiglobus ruber]|uniref:Myo-inositol 2-dehydrogenase n=1 Tax=Fimbriiglobus ruber TaxID=1908690 RepID=A0A225DW20_9BACT|nr:Gfo/Idh/MocA family oxidoreductase [Fimbriiglobus ruber]OWK41836.1 Myo-inositol 2-dehydrogenase [Fimbriiglobus ruber]
MAGLLLPTRRTFLQTAAATGAVAFGAPAVQARGANEKLNIGLIGSGNRGRTILREAMRLGHRAVALCDIAEFRLETVAKAVDEAEQDKPKFYSDYRKLLEHPSLDAVIITTPDHHHKEILVAAMQAEKDAYVEKPLTKSIDEGAEMIEAVRKANRVVQVGNQRHSGPHWEECVKVVKSSAFGKLVWAKVWDTRNWVKKDPFAPPKDFRYDPRTLNWEAFLGNAPKRAFDPLRYWSWRWYWDYAGGLMTDIGAHQLDIVAWIGGTDVPKSAVANGGVYQFKHWETPDVIHGIWDYGKFAANFAVQFVNGADGVGAGFYGTKQTLLCDAEKEIRLYDTAEKITPDMRPVQTWRVEPETPLHVKNWVECVKSREDPNSTIELGHRVILAAHLANLSYRTGKKIFWDADRKEVIGS